FITSDGTVQELVEPPRETWHANFTNDYSLGVETGHCWEHDPGSDHLGPNRPVNHWIRLSSNPNVDDYPGVNFWFRWRSFTEVVVTQWITDNYNGPWESPQTAPEMLFSEWQYRSWALLARWLAEEFAVPRNFPVLPFRRRTDTVSDDASF